MSDDVLCRTMCWTIYPLLFFRGQAADDAIAEMKAQEAKEQHEQYGTLASRYLSQSTRSTDPLDPSLFFFSCSFGPFGPVGPFGSLSRTGH